MSDLAPRLADLASRGATITYGALARDLGWRIEALMEEDARAGHPLRAALCEGRLAGGQPAQGFFLKAAELGFDTQDPAGFVADQRARLFKT